jgi:PAS domain S-box-containing protein
MMINSSSQHTETAPVLHPSVQELYQSLAALEAALNDQGGAAITRVRQQIEALTSQLDTQAQQIQMLQQELAESKQHDDMLKMLFDNTHIGVAFVSGSDQIFKFANEAYLKLVPHPGKEVMGKTVAEVWPSEEGFTAVAWHQKVHRQGETIHDQHITRTYPDGSVRHFSVHAEPSCWQNEEGVLIIAHEISDVVEANLEAEDSKRILDALMQYIPEGITIADAPDVNIRRVSRFGQMLTGRPLEQIEGISMEAHPEHWQIHDLDGTLVPPERLPLSRATLTGEVVENEELLLRRPDGEEIVLLCNAGPIRSDTGEITGGLIAWRDVTERKQAELELKRRDETMQKMLDSIPVMVTMYRPDVQRITVNKEFERITGWKDAEIQHMDIMAACYPDPHYRQKVSEFMSRLTGWMDIDLTIKDGSVIETSWSNIRLSDDTHIGIGLDMRAQKQAQRDLVESEARFRALADNIAQFAWMADPTGWIYWYNQRWFDYTGTTLDEMQGWGWQSVHHPEHVERVTVKFKHHIDTGQPWEDTFPLRGKDGQYRWFLSRALPISDGDGQVMQWFGTNTDITAQLEVEEALRQSEERFRIALEGSPMVAFCQDNELHYTWVNNPREGFEIGGVIGKRDEDLFEPEEAAILTAFKREVLNSPVAIKRELTYRVGGRSVTYFLTAEPTRDEHGQVTGLIAAAIDMTDIRRMEQEALEQRTRIEVQRRLIAQREEERARIAREIHDGPVQSMSVLLFQLEELNWITHAEERHAKVEVIGEAIQNEIKILRSLCNELRPSTLHFFGLEKAIRSHVDSLSERYPDVEFDLNLTSDHLSIPADIRLEMYRILQEALTNSLKHASATHVRVVLVKEGDTITLQIEDNGQGFALRPHLVDYARQGSLGLIGMNERAEIIGAEFQVETNPGRGTRITLRVCPPVEE